MEIGNGEVMRYSIWDKGVEEDGNSWKTPFPGDEIQVNYRVKLQDGNFFDSSYDRGKPFTFKLGQGEVIKGWDEGIATMKKSERAIFTIPPNLAYGEIGSPPVKVEATPRDIDEVLVKYVASSADGKVLSKSDDGVEFSLFRSQLIIWEIQVLMSDGVGILLSNSNLIIHVELISWKSVVDVTGDNKVLKKIIKAGEGYDHPNRGSLAKENSGKSIDERVFRIGSIQQHYELTFGKRFMNSAGEIDEQGQEFKGIVSNGIKIGGKLPLAECLSLLPKQYDLSDDTVIGLLWDMITAGMDTTTITVEWAMAELVRNPRAQQKAQEELDLAKEALRLHPPTPLMLPHKASASVKIDGRRICLVHACYQFGHVYVGSFVASFYVVSPRGVSLEDRLTESPGTVTHEKSNTAIPTPRLPEHLYKRVPVDM
ncbi:hypothetical protein HAX54_025640 [Datura stramonium]|uniref:peptidylprolyl isomerase n=1 Tax=Datura stramonium TaxID=4076 RepID=A0ABS8V0H0_DATST|nr:hypothetical protein [Datura stramonium]